MPTPSCLPASIASLSFVPTPSLAATSSGSRIARGLQVEESAEPAQLGIGARPGRRAGKRAHGFDERIACVDRHAGVGIGQRLLRHLAPPSHKPLGFPRRYRQKRPPMARRPWFLPALLALFGLVLAGVRAGANGELATAGLLRSTALERSKSPAFTSMFPARTRSRHVTRAGGGRSGWVSRRSGPMRTSARPPRHRPCRIRLSTSL